MMTKKSEVNENVEVLKENQGQDEEQGKKENKGSWDHEEGKEIRDPLVPPEEGETVIMEDHVIRLIHPCQSSRAKSSQNIYLPGMVMHIQPYCIFGKLST